MHLFTRNVNSAFQELVQLFKDSREDYPDVGVVKKPSRNGDVLMIDEPVTITYSHPRERVLFNSARDCNPFFHLYEALWMLAGRNDLAPLQYYISDYGRFSDDGKTLNGAYGYRWRKSWTSRQIGSKDRVDQLDLLVNHLKAVPNSRRAVLTMWNVEDDLLKIGQPTEYAVKQSQWGPYPTEGQSKDVCCNLNVMFSLREIDPEIWSETGKPRPAGVMGRAWKPAWYELDMTVTNRSNDMILGMLGANYVHFTMLQEYMAARLGVEVGKYHHITNNLHVYTKDWEPEKWLADEQPNWYVNANLSKGQLNDQLVLDLWGKDLAHRFPLVKDPAVFEKELPVIVNFYGGDNGKKCSPLLMYNEPFFEDVASHALNAFRLHKHRLYPDALAECRLIKADDWRIACTQWIEKRKRQYEGRKGAPHSQGIE